MNSQQVDQHQLRQEFDRRHIRVVYEGSLYSSGMEHLCQTINKLHEHYQAELIWVELNSPGGEVSCLQRWQLERLGWQKAGLKIGLIAGDHCASLAALQLALGEVGMRWASASSHLLLHTSRVQLSSRTPLVAQTAVHLSKRLEKTDLTMKGLLRDHLVQSLGELGLADLLARRVNALRKPPADLAPVLLHLDELHAERCGRTSQWLKQLNRWPQHHPGTADDAGTWLKAWTKVLDAVLDADRFLSPLAMWSLGLLDQIGDPQRRSWLPTDLPTAPARQEHDDPDSHAGEPVERTARQDVPRAA